MCYAAEATLACTSGSNTLLSELPLPSMVVTLFFLLLMLFSSTISGLSCFFFPDFFFTGGGCSGWSLMERLSSCPSGVLPPSSPAGGAGAASCEVFHLTQRKSSNQHLDIFGHNNLFSMSAECFNHLQSVLSWLEPTSVHSASTAAMPGPEDHPDGRWR